MYIIYTKNRVYEGSICGKKHFTIGLNRINTAKPLISRINPIKRMYLSWFRKSIKFVKISDLFDIDSVIKAAMEDGDIIWLYRKSDQRLYKINETNITGNTTTYENGFVNFYGQLIPIEEFLYFGELS